MKLCKIAIKKLILLIVLISILIMFFATPVSNAKLDLEEGDFYYSGTTEGSYKPSTSNIFNWLINLLGEIADWILGMLTLAPRMVFVGWTALIEKLLTWGVESASGVSVDGSIVNSSTDLTDVTDSNNNITVEAIVFNKVAAFDVNIFDTEFDRTLSATGHKMVCEKCEEYTDEHGLTRYKPKYVDECCNQDIANQILENPEAYKDLDIDDVPDFCTCKCEGCDACSLYFEQLAMEEPIIVKIKQTVATWYYIIRILAMAAMLVVLIVIGIKMAISTIASDKAVYKRMLFDWVVGIIILFAIHYFMIFVVNVNAIIVEIIETSASQMNANSMESALEVLGLDPDTELEAKDLEIRVYEEIRSRAYDAKLSNGMIGMIMYMALVFMSVKFTVIYIKRLFTIMILALTGPCVGLAYALQKALSGKSQALKTWMTEFVMNVIIQIVHALIYAIFISQALILSLTNISGMIIALLLLNYTSKAEELFKKIFKFGDEDSLLSHTDNAMKALEENIGMARGVIKGAPKAAKILTNTPYAKALKSAGKYAVAGATIGIGKLYNKREDGREEREYEKQFEKEFSKVQEEHRGYATRSDKNAEMEDMQKQAIKRLAAKGIIDPRTKKAEEEKAQRRVVDTEEALRIANDNLAKKEAIYLRLTKNPNKGKLQDKKKAQAKYEEALEEVKKAEQEQEKAKSDAEKYNIPLSSKDIARAHIAQLFDIENYFRLSRPEGVSDSKTEKRNSFSDVALGTTYFDPYKMKYVRRDDGLYKQFSAENLLGFSKEDKKVFKEQVLNPIKQSFTGMGCLFMGMGLMVTEPGIGMALLAKGIPATHRTFHKGPNNDKYKNKKFKFSRFKASTINNMKNATIEQSRKERRKLRADKLKDTRKDFVEKFKSGDIKAVTLGVAVLGPLAPAAAIMHPIKTTKAIGRTAKNSGAAVANFIKSSNSEKVETVKSAGKSAANFAGNMVKTTASLPKEALNVAGNTANATKYAAGKFYRRMSISDNLDKVESHAATRRKDIEQGLREEAAQLMGMQTKAEFNFLMKQLDKEREEEANELGYDYNSKTDVMTRKETVESSDLKESKVTNSKPNEKEIDKLLDQILEKHKASDGRIDLSSKGIQDNIIEELTVELQVAKIIDRTERVEDLFKGGRSAIVKTIKGKSAKRNAVIEEKSTRATLESVLSKEELKTVNEITNKSRNGESVESILEKMSGQFNPSKDGSSKVNTSRTGDQVVVFKDAAKNAAVANYVAAHVATSRTKKSINSKRKVEEALSMLLPEDTSSNATTKKNQDLTLENMLKQVNTSGKVTNGKRTVNLSKEEADAATRMLSKLLEMKTVNEVTVRDLDMKKGTREYTKARQQKSILSIQINELEKQSIQIDQNQAKYTNGQDAASIHLRIAEKTSERNRVDQKMKMAGPAIDINRVITDMKKNGVTGNRSKRGGVK